MRVSDAVQSGDRLTILVAVRDDLAGKLDAAGSRESAAIARELSSVLRQIDELSAPLHRGILDELHARRARRESAADISKPSR